MTTLCYCCRFQRLALAAFVIQLLLTIGADAQISAPTSAAEPVRLTFFVMDSHGGPVGVIKPADITVFDDKKPAQSVVKVGLATELPLRLGLLIDTSGSGKSSNLLLDVVKASNAFVAEQLSGEQNKGFIATFSDTFQATHMLTSDQFSKTRIDVHPNGGTALYDALRQACRERMQSEDQDASARRVLLLVTDGDDNASRMSLEELIPEVQRCGSTVFAVSTRGKPLSGHSNKVLLALTTATGGLVFFPERPDQIPVVFGRLKAVFNSMHYVNYVPEKDNVGKFHKVGIRIATGGDLYVQAPESYYREKTTTH